MIYVVTMEVETDENTIAEYFELRVDATKCKSKIYSLTPWGHRVPERGLISNFSREGIFYWHWEPPIYPHLKFYREIDSDTFERFKSTRHKNVRFVK